MHDYWATSVQSAVLGSIVLQHDLQVLYDGTVELKKSLCAGLKPDKCTLSAFFVSSVS